MAWNKQHKSQTKDIILKSAAFLFTQNGYEKVSIDLVMQEAKLTRGAFYAHFKSKSDLYSQAITKAALVAQDRKPENSNQDLKSIGRYYLSKAHRDDLWQQPCPLASLVSDMTQQNETVRDTYTKVFRGFVQQANKHTNDKEKALQSAALMIGGLAISKALNDKALSDTLLLACQNAICEMS